MGPPVATVTASPDPNDTDALALAQQAGVNAPPTGFASLDVELPKDTSKYDVFLFTTPQDDLRITARPISSSLATRLTGIACLAAIVALIWVLTRRGVCSTLRDLARSPFVGLVLVALGVAALITHILPMAGLLLGMVGICQITSWLVARGTGDRASA
jgi:hypothetical protein